MKIPERQAGKKKQKIVRINVVRSSINTDKKNAHKKKYI